MLDRIEEQIKALGCTVWELREQTVKAWEFYFIRHALDQNRITEVETVNVTLYRLLEDGMLGSASGKLSPTASDDEIGKTLADIYEQASLVKNPAYTLTDKPVEAPALQEVNVEAIAEDFISAMSKVQETETEFVNSYEIFVKEITRHYRNSNGVEYTVRYPSSMIEVVVNARKEDHEIELYRMYDSGTCDADKLCRDVEKTLRYGKDRLVTEPTPKLNEFDVLFSTDDAVQIYRYFAIKTNTALLFRHLSDWTVGKNVAENATGDRVTVKAVSSLHNSSKDYPIDEEGAAIQDRVLIRSGVVENLWGPRQYSQYLGVENGSMVQNFVVEGGARSEAEVRQGDYLEVVEFSDFEVDPFGGNIAGEIRLGYLHQNGTVKIVSGGSVTGQMAQAVPTMEFSSETEQYDTCVIPRVTRLKDLKITGIA
ncbi:MAG: TldD/PmbA family protein [Oscillospiraceae bacterium]|nr:TldD/PmbA family protein [Oscillospiraceae bacterium]